MNFFSRPGTQTSEFAITILNVIAQVALAWSDQISTGMATTLSVAGAVAYAISRGLAKYEPRANVPPTSPTPPTA